MLLRKIIKVAITEQLEFGNAIIFIIGCQFKCKIAYRKKALIIKETSYMALKEIFICVTDDHGDHRYGRSICLVQSCPPYFLLWLKHHRIFIKGNRTGATNGARIVYRPFRSTHVASEIFNWVNVTMKCYDRHCFSFYRVSFGCFIVCSSIHGSWLHLWYLQNFLINFPCKPVLIISLINRLQISYLALSLDVKKFSHHSYIPHRSSAKRLVEDAKGDRQ